MIDVDADISAQLATRRWEAELAVVGSILADPAAGIVAANNAGVAQWDFGQPDLKLIYLAAEVAHDHGRMAVVALAKRALIDAAMWDETQIRGNWSISMRWSAESLAALAESSYPNPSLVSYFCRQLVKLIQAERVVRRCVRRGERAIVAALEKPKIQFLKRTTTDALDEQRPEATSIVWRNLKMARVA